VRLARPALIATAAALMSGYAALAVVAITQESEIPWRLFYVDWVLRYWPHRTKLFYQFNVELRPNSDLEYLSRYGWSEPEDWGVWIDGAEASLLLRLASAPVRNLRLRARLRGEVDWRYPQIVADVIVNGTSVTRWTLESDEPEVELEAEIPASVISVDQLLQLTFRIRDPSPSSGLGAHPRLGVISVVLSPTETP